MSDFDGPIADSLEALASRLRTAGRVLIDRNAELERENARLNEALDLLRPAHHTPYEDEDHQGGNCVDIAMRYCVAWHKAQVAEAALRTVREWCDDADKIVCSHQSEHECIRCDAIKDCAAAVRSLLPDVPSEGEGVDMGTRVTRADREYPGDDNHWRNRGGTDSGN